MSPKRVWIGVVLVVAVSAGSTLTAETLLKSAGGKTVSREAESPLVWNFENVRKGSLPPGWRSEATNGDGHVPVWRVVSTSDAPSGSHVLTMERAARPYGSAFNLCWTDTPSFGDGSAEVRFKALRGKIDQGGGIAWRIQDRNNYYVVRFNPLEDNFRLYYVKNGRRTMLASADIRLSPDEWHRMKITQRHDQIRCYLDGKLLLKARDRHFDRPGGVGLWTKADAVTGFDDFTVKTEGDER